MLGAVARRVVISGVLLVSAMSPATAMAAHPNDAYTAARSVALDQNEVVSNAGAGPVDASDTTRAEPLTAAGEGYCNDGQYSATSGVDMTHTIWWRVVGDGSPVTIDTRGSAIDTVVAVYRGAPSGATLVACNDDIRSGTSANLDSEAVFNTDAGATYFVQVGCATGCATPEGNIDFIAWSSPPGDFRDEAIPIDAGQEKPGDVRGATEEGSENLDCGDIPFSRTVWFRYRAPASGMATFAAGGTFDTVLAVYRGTERVGCSDDPSQVRTRVTAGDYLIQVGAVGIAPDADYGSFQATVGFTPDPPPDRDGDGVADANDRCPDQNASARDANRDGCLDPLPPDPDPDKDGVPVPQDKCPGENAAGRDANRDGCLDPRRLAADAKLRARPTSTGLRLVFLRVSAPKGARVLVRCGRRCRFSRKASVAGAPTATAARTLSVRAVKNRSFKAGQRIRIYVTRPARIGVYIEYRITRGGFRRIKRCLEPGSMKPRRRCG